MSSIKIKYRDFCECLLGGTNFDLFLRQNHPELDEENISLILTTLSKSFLPHFNKKTDKVNRDRARFKKIFSEWMENEYVFNIPDQESIGFVGRPSKDFDDCGERNKRNKIRSLQASYQQSLINAAATHEGTR